MRSSPKVRVSTNWFFSRLVTAMNLDRWAARIYDENDIGRGIATTLAGVGGLSTYLYWGDWVIAAFVAIIVFPVGRIATSAIHSRWDRSRESRKTKVQIAHLFESLGSEERATVQAFVWVKIWN